MENTPNIYEKLYNISDIAKARKSIIEYIKDQKHYFESLTKETYVAAYQLAGLMATDYAASLSDTDPVIDILSLAGELEIAPSDSDDLRNDILRKIIALQ